MISMLVSPPADFGASLRMASDLPIPVSRVSYGLQPYPVTLNTSNDTSAITHRVIDPHRRSVRRAGRCPDRRPFPPRWPVEPTCVRGRPDGAVTRGRSLRELRPA